MTRKIPIVFALSLGFTFSILLAVVGEGGYLHNRALRKEIARLTYEQSSLSLQVDSLKQQREEATKVDALKDAAFKYGYQSEGEQVYYFSMDDQDMSSDVPQVSVTTNNQKIFSGIRTIYIACISLGIALIISVWYGWIGKRRGDRYVQHR